MDGDTLSWSVIGAAAGVAFVHTALGPDHTLPFVALGRARGWSRGRTLAVTAACGTAHVLSSLLLGLAGLALGLGVGHVESVESGRGELAAWALAAFGLAYGLWGARRAYRARRGLVLHGHGSGAHVHAAGDEPHVHGETPREATVWALFVVFVLGPCEPLLPLFVLPASQGRWSLAVAAALVFTLVTLGTMLALVALANAGVRALPLGALERWSHALAGAVLLGSGLSILLLDL